MSELLHTPPVIPKVRPRFLVESNLPEEEIARRIKAALKAEGAPCIGRIKDGYATLFLPPEEQHYWSPELSLTLEATETGSSLRGMYGPRPAVWTMFIFFYSLIGFAILLVTIFGFSYRSIGQSGAILWLIPILVIVFLSLYLVAHSGQKLGHDQMVILHNFVEKSTGLTIQEEYEV